MSAAADRTQTHFTIREHCIAWKDIRMIELKATSLVIILESQERIQLEFDTPELMDAALEQAFSAAFARRPAL